MKRDKISIKWKIFFYLLIFIVVLLLALWLFQICYLDLFYKNIRTGTAKRVREQAVRILTEQGTEAEDAIDLLAEKNDLSVYVADADGKRLFQTDYMPSSHFSAIPEQEFDSFYQKAKENGNSAEIIFYGDDPGVYKKPPVQNQPKDSGAGMQTQPGDAAGLQIRQEQMPPRPFWRKVGNRRQESVLYVTILEVNGQEIVFLMNCMLTPVDATVDTLKIQMICISIFMVVLSLILAWVISRQISKSMIKVNDSARKMAQGDYDAVFDGKDYREIAELSDTLNYTAKELGRTEALRRELIANVSHDLRTPLTMITAYAQAMQDLPGENTPENIQVVIDEAERLTNLVNDMLDLSRLQSGVPEKEERIYNLTESIQSVLKRYNKLAEQEGYRICFQYDRPVWIRADEYKMYQVIYNLVNNAINYTGEDRRVIVEQTVSEGYVRIAVTDSGAGIAAEDLPYIWDRYYKVDKSHKRAVTGTGLGLSIVKNILDLHHASYGAESREGAGSTFWFELPEEVI